jgi:hypothetical protein
LILAGEAARGAVSVALYTGADGATLQLLRSATVKGDEYPSLRPVVRRFTAGDLPMLRAACFAVGADPPWSVDAGELAAATGLSAAVVEVVTAATALAESPEPSVLLGAASRALRRLAGLASAAGGEGGPT